MKEVESIKEGIEGEALRMVAAHSPAIVTLNPTPVE
jgi:hypothetical protein